VPGRLPVLDAVDGHHRRHQSGSGVDVGFEHDLASDLFKVSNLDSVSGDLGIEVTDGCLKFVEFLADRFEGGDCGANCIIGINEVLIGVFPLRIGVYDVGDDEGWVSVGDTADTAEFAVASDSPLVAPDGPGPVP